MERLSNRVIALFLMSVVAVCLAIGLGGGCNTGTPEEKLEQTQITVDEATQADAPLDCVPDPDGAHLYFIASKGAERAVFKVGEDGKVTEVFVGAPLVDARGISISSDGAVLYLADPKAGTNGALFALDIVGGTPTEIAGTSGTAPRAVDVLAGTGQDEIFFTGTTAAGKAAVFKIVTVGQPVQVVFEGSPLQRPDGVLAARSGDVFVTDAGTDPGKVYRIAGGSAEPLGGDLKLGSPAGVSALMDESTILVSSLDPAKGTSQVALIDPVDGKTTTFNGTISGNKVSGGLHRAHYADKFGWAGYDTVYFVSVKGPKPGSTPGGPAN